MDLFTIPIMFKHFCDSMTCITQTDYVTINDLDLLVIGMNCFYGFVISYFYLDWKKRKQQKLERVE